MLTNNLRSLRAAGALAGFASLAAVTGCAMDRFFDNKPVPTGPTVSLADPHSPAALPLPSDAQEVDLVENVITNRDEYVRNLQQLRDYYREHGYATKERWADFELDGLRRVRAFKYLIDSEVPSQQLSPVGQIPEADALYSKGLSLMKKGGAGIPGLYRQTPMIQAAEAFQELIERYPSSDKIDDAAFYLGEIHKEYFKDQEQIAVRWYEKAMEWDPHTPHPVRFEAAVVYDYRLHDRDRALELYHAVLKDEATSNSNVRFATRRIRELTREPRTGQADAR